MARQRKQSRRQQPARGPLEQRPAREQVVLRYELHKTPGMDGPDWIPREMPAPSETQARMMLEQLLVELAAPSAPPIRHPYLVRLSVYEQQLTDPLADVTAETEANATQLAQLRAHLAAGGTVEAGS